MPGEWEEISVLCVDRPGGSAARTAPLLERADEGITVHTVTEPEAAFERIARGTVDCVVSAFDLPGIGGIQFLQAVRAAYPELPFVLYAPDGSEELATAAFAAKASDYVRQIGSPSGNEEFAARIRAAAERERTAAEMPGRTERAGRVLEAAPDAVVVAVDGELAYANRAAAELFEVPDREDLLGTELTSLVPSDVDPWTDGCLPDGELARWHASITTSGGDRPVELVANRLTWGTDEGVALVVRDRSGRSDWESGTLRLHDRLEEIIDTLPAAIFLKDPGGRYLLMNGQCREMLDVDDSETVVGMTDGEIFDETYANQYQAGDRLVLEGAETLEFEETVPTVEGERTMLTRKTPICSGDGEPYALCAVSTDITAQKERELDLRERVKELSAIHRAVSLFESDCRPTVETLEDFVACLPESFQYPDRTEARVAYGSVAISTSGFDRSGPTLQGTAELDDGTPVRIEVVCTAEPKDGCDDPFLPEEKNLLETLSTVVAGYLERQTYLEELERYEATLRALGDPVYALDSEGQFTFVNDAFLERAGYESEDLLGEYPSVVIPSPDLERGTSLIRELLDDDERETAKCEMDLETADGERIPTEANIALLTDDGQFHGTAGVLRDITERTEREAELQRRKDMLVRTERIADVGGWELDFETERLYWTEGARLIHEVESRYDPTLDEALEFYHPDDREAVETAVERCWHSGEPFDIEKRLITAEGRERWVHVRGECVEKNGTRQLRGTIQDITKTRESEQQLMVLNRVLRHNLRNNLNVVTANAELLRDQLSDLQLIAELPEEGRQELPGIVARNLPAESELDPATVEHLVEQICSFPVSEATEYLEQLETNAWELLAIADKSRKLAGTIEQAGAAGTVDIESLLSSIVEEQRLFHPDAVLTLDTVAATVDGNPASVRLAVEELLENALKHGGEEPTVTITVRQPTPERIELTVADDGPGLPETERKALREGEETALKHGSGLGLWTVNWLLTRLGGTISLDGTDDGTTIRVELPAESATSA